MADNYTTFSRPGQANNANATDALFLKLFSGEVLASFDRTTVMQGLVRERTVSGQKSAQFPLTGRATAGYHSPGEEITPDAIAHNEKTITIDGLMYATTFVDDWEDMVSHYEVRSVYAGELGASLAFNYDKHLLRRLCLSAREANALYGADGTQKPASAGDNVITDNDLQLATGDTITPGSGGASSVAVKAQAIADAIFAAQAKFDNAYVPESQEKYCILRPKDYYDLLAGVQSSGFSVINRDYGGAGSYADGKVLKLGGVTILKSPNLPSTNVAQSGSAAGIDYYHYGDFSNTVGVVFTADAIGAVRLMGLGVQTDYQVERQGTLMVARQSVGIGTLRPECAVELVVS